MCLEQEDKEQASEIVEQYHERNQDSITAARFCLFFADDLDYDDERKLQACMDYAKLDCSNCAVINTMMELLPKGLQLSS